MENIFAPKKKPLSQDIKSVVDKIAKSIEKNYQEEQALPAIHPKNDGIREILNEP